MDHTGCIDRYRINGIWGIAMKGLDEMKKRILKAHKYREDLVEPLSEVLGLEKEKTIDLIIRNLDMVRLQGLHPRYENRRKNVREKIVEKKVERDLHLPLIANYLSIVDREDAEEIKGDVVEKVLSGGKEYETALGEAKEELQERMGDVK